MERAERTRIIREYYKYYGLVDYLSIKDKIIEKLPEEKIEQKAWLEKNNVVKLLGFIHKLNNF